ncbi:beta strand repeat-containing protein, partial [Vibrio vulnificus]
MDFTAFLAGASLTAGRIVVLDLNGNIKILAPGQAIAPGELVIETLEETDVPQFRIATDAGETNITDDIQQIFAALEEGLDPTQLGDDFATAAGETGGSSLVAGGTISRTGAESLASTDFSTQGLQALGLSEAQSLALANQIRAFNEQITIVEPTPDDRPTVSSISSFEVAEGESATFDVTLSNASTTATTVTLTLVGDSATAGTDFSNTSVTITYENGTTAPVAVNTDGTFEVSVPADDTTFSVSVATTDDAEYEGDETFTLSGQTATQASAVTGTATITDDGSNGGTDNRPTVSSISSPIVSEGDSATFEVNLSNASTTATTVTLTLAGDTATAGTDFTDSEVTVTYKDGTTQTVAVNGDGTFAITVPAGDTHFSISVQTTDDGVYEGDETFALSGKTATQSTAMTGTATLKDDGSVTPPDGTSDDDRPAVSSISSPFVSEGDSATFEVNLSNASTTATTVTLTLTGDSATAGTDFTDTEVTVTYKDGTTETVAVNGDGTFVITVPAGDTHFSVSVQTTDDGVYEGDETFALSGKTATQSTAMTGTATLKDDGSVTPPDGTSDDDRPAVSSISSPIVSEGESATFEVNLSNASTTTTTVTLTLAGDSATAGTDFTDTEVTVTYKDGTTETVAVNGDGTFVITVPAGDTHFSVSVQTTDDGVYEGDETFTLSGQTATQSTAMTGTATLKDDGSVTPPDGTSDDDRPAVSSISSPTVSEGESATFEVNLSNASTTATTVTLTLAGDSATAGTDFTDSEVTVTYKDGTTQTVVVNGDGTFAITVPAGDTHFSVSVQTTDDGVYEGDETFTLSGKTATQSTAMTGTAMLKDDGSVTPPDGTSDDDRPAVSEISSPTVSEGESATFEVNLSNASTTATTVTLTLAGDSATAGTDFTDSEVTVTYKDGTTQTVVVNGDGTFAITVPAGDTHFSVSVQTTDDGVYEGDETFTLSGKTATQSTAMTGTATLKDDGSVTPPDGTSDDDRPAVSEISSPTVSEGDSATFDVSLSNASTTATTVTLTLAGDSATKNVDFNGTSVSVIINGVSKPVSVNDDGTFSVDVPANTTTFSVSVETTDDDVYEGSESFTLSGKTVTQETAITGTATIKDDGSVTPPDLPADDDRPAVSEISSPTVSEGDSATFDISLSNASTTATTVTLTLAGASATAGTDFTDTEVTVTYKDGTTQTVAVNGDGTFAITVPAGDTHFSVSVQTTDDGVYEVDETFTLSGKTAIQSTTVTGAAVIKDNDTLPVLKADVGTVNEDDLLIVTAENGLLSNDSDVDSDILTVTGILSGSTGTATAVNASGETVLSNSYGTLTIRADGSYSFNANGEDAQKLAAGQTAPVVFTYTASDGTESLTNTLTITITGTNDSPVITNDAAQLAGSVV